MSPFSTLYILASIFTFVTAEPSCHKICEKNSCETLRCYTIDFKQQCGLCSSNYKCNSMSEDFKRYHFYHFKNSRSIKSFFYNCNHFKYNFIKIQIVSKFAKITHANKSKV